MHRFNTTFFNTMFKQSTTKNVDEPYVKVIIGVALTDSENGEVQVQLGDPVLEDIDGTDGFVVVSLTGEDSYDPTEIYDDTHPEFEETETVYIGCDPEAGESDETPDPAEEYES